jgi:hypothetical protein
MLACDRGGMARQGNETVDALRAIMDEEDTVEVRAEELKDKGCVAAGRAPSPSFTVHRGRIGWGWTHDTLQCSA